MENLRPDDVANAEHDKGECIDGILRGKVVGSTSDDIVKGPHTFFVCPLVLLALDAYTDERALPNVPMR